MFKPKKCYRQSGGVLCLTGVLFLWLVQILMGPWKARGRSVGWESGGGIGKRNWGVVAALLLLAVPGLMPNVVEAATKPSDIEALLAVKALITHHNGILDQWTRSTDPCEVPWVGVTCNCTAFTLLDLECDPTDVQLEARVLTLKLGSEISRAEEAKFNGTISEEIGRLDQLRFLDLSTNNFQGSLPSSLQRLKELRFLSVSENQLSGKLPGFFGELEHLQTLHLDSNQFSGPIPESWCTDDWEVDQVSVNNNMKLCGNVPTCLQDKADRETQKIPSVDATFLRKSSSDPKTICDETPPICDESKGCGVYTPAFWTEPHRITFQFHEFEDLESNITGYTFTVQLMGGETGLEPIVDNLPIENDTNLRDTVEDVQHIDDENLRAIRHTIVHNLTGIGLRSGSQYNVTVTATNGAGPPLEHSITSKPVRVDATRPAGGEDIFNTGQFENSDQQKPGQLGISWAPFEDEESNVTEVTVQLREVDETGAVVRNVTDPKVVDSNVNSSSIEAELQPDAWYQFEIRATNEAGLNTTKLSNTFSAMQSSSTGSSQASTQTMIGVLCVVGGFVIMASSIVIIGRNGRGDMREESCQIVKAFMEGLLDTGSDMPKHRPEVLKDHSEMAFVVTDLEGSTEMSNISEAAFKTLLNIHDEIMRYGIHQHGGYEINTEGDAFLMAFTSVVDAVLFCMETQYRFLNAKWPMDVLRFEKCRMETTVKGELMYRGPRVRMAIHWADDTTNKLHPTTKCRVFEGPGFELTKTLADAAHGGQVLMTHDTWLKLQANMGISGFPTVEQIGEFSVESRSIWIYQITQLVARPLRRTFPPPRKLTLLKQGWGFSIVPPPVPNTTKTNLAFVAARTVFPPGGIGELNQETAEQLFEVLASQAQQFKGFIYRRDKQKGRFLLVFSKTLDAVRFSHAAQVVMLHTDWPVDVEEECGPSEFSPLGQPIFHGPRVAIAVHFTKGYTLNPQADGLPNQGQWMDYDGPGGKFVKKLSLVVNGGQVVLSEPAWGDIHRSPLPGHTQSISLGKHKLDAEFKNPLLLMEVMPEMLKHREFAELGTEMKLEPGYRDSPPDNENIVIAFVKAVKPKAVEDAERSKEASLGGDSRDRKGIVEAYLQSVQEFSRLVRKRLLQYRGYECKEPETGKLTLAFWEIDNAVRWCAHIQLELMNMDWPEVLLEMDGCREVRANTGELLERGLKVRMGMAFGKPGMKKPLSSGRADYFGHLPNLAARVSSQAAPGQILVECSPGFGEKVAWIKEGSVGLIKFKEPLEFNTGQIKEEAIELQEVGCFLLKGFDNDLKLIYQARPLSLLKREFPMQPNAIRVAPVGRSLSGAKDLRRRIQRNRSSWALKVNGSYNRLVNGLFGTVGMWRQRSKGSTESGRSSNRRSDISLMGSSSTLICSPRNHSGTPRRFDVFPKLKLPATIFAHTSHSPGPSQGGLEDGSLASQGSWGESVHRIHSGSGLSVTSRGASSLWRSNIDASMTPSPRPDTSPFSNASEDMVDMDGEGPGTSLSFRPRPPNERMLSLRNSYDELAGHDEGIGSHGSGGSVDNHQQSYIKILAGLFVPTHRRQQSATFEFPTPVEPSPQSSPTMHQVWGSDIENQLHPEGSRSKSAPDMLRFSCFENISSSDDSGLLRAQSLHAARKQDKLEKMAIQHTISLNPMGGSVNVDDIVNDRSSSESREGM